MTNIQSQLQNRTALKYNWLTVGEKGGIVADRNGDNLLCFSMEDITTMLNLGSFENFITVSIDGENGNIGPNVKPSQKAIKRLLRIIRNTNYKIVQQNGQTFTLEGLN